MELIDCIELPVLVVDRDLALVSFNPAAAKLLSLMGSDRGRQLRSIQMLAGVKNLSDLCEHVIASESSHRLEIEDGAGSWFSLNIGCHKANRNIKGAVLTLTNVTAFRESLERAIEEREYTKAVINTIADALVIVDAGLRIQAANQAFYTLFQTSRGLSQGATFDQLGSGDWDIPRLRSLIDGSSASDDYQGSLECDQELAAGRRTLLLNARRLDRGGQAGRLTLITIQDITERKSALVALRESEQRFRMITEAAPIMVWMSGTDKLCYYFNKGWLDFVGRTLEQELGNGWAENVHPDDFHRCLQIYVESFDARRPFEMEYRIRHHDGQYRWILDHAVPRYAPDGTFEGYVGGCLDIHDQKEAAEKVRVASETLRESEARFRALVTASSDVVYRMSPDWSEMRQLRGRDFIADTEEPSHTWLEEYIHPDDQARVMEGIDEAIRTRTAFAMEHRVPRVDGSLGWTFSRAIPLENANGELIEWFGTATDVTERKRTEEALLRSGKLASVSRMAASIAHEINNPLEAVTNTLYLARTNADDPASVRNYLDIAEDELKHISHITRQTLGFYRESSAPAKVSVNSIMDSAVDLLQRKIQARGARIEKQYDADLQIVASAGELRQVFSNLLVNSLEAIEERGAIRLRVSRSTCVDTGQHRIRVTIADNGSGIDAATLPRIFDPLFTTKEVTGSGLGLWVSKQIIEKHGGSIRVRSRTTAPHSSSNGAYRGTAFSILLPVEPPALTAQ